MDCAFVTTICLYLFVMSHFWVKIVFTSDPIQGQPRSLLAVKQLQWSSREKAWVGVVHNCTIFLCSLDVRNIVQGGDPLYAAVNYKHGCGGFIWPKWLLCLGAKILFFGLQNFFFWAQGGSFFLTFLSFQNLMSPFKIYWVHYNLPSLYWVTQ